MTSPTPRTTKSQQREDARAAALRVQEQQQREAKRQRAIVITLLVVAVLAIGGIVWWILSNASEETSTRDFSASENPLSEVVAPQGAAEDGAILVGPDGVAGSTEGAADDAVEVTVYSDYLCPFCSLFEETNGPVLDELRGTGDVVVAYHLVSILDRAAAGSQYSTRSATAAALVADSAPEAFVEFNALLMANQPAEGAQGLADALIADLARSAGASDDVAAAIADGSYMTGEDSFAPWVAALTEQATRDLPRLATPTVLIDGQELSELGVDWRVEGALAAAVAQVRG